MRKLVAITLGLITSALITSTEVSESKSVVSNDPSVPGKCRPHSPCPGLPRLPGPTA